MPLKRGASRKVIGSNIATEMKTKPRRQAIAIALSEARRTGKGKNVPPKPKGK